MHHGNMRVSGNRYLGQNREVFRKIEQLYIKYCYQYFLRHPKMFEKKAIPGNPPRTRSQGTISVNHLVNVCIVLLCACCIFLPQPVFAEHERTQIVVGYESDLPPINYSIEGKAQGFTIDLLRAIFKDQHINILFIPLNQNDALRQIPSGQIDIIAGIPYSSHLSDIVEYSDPVFTSSIGVLAPVKIAQDKNFTNLSEMIVALQSNSVEYDFLKNVRRIRYQVSNSQRKALRFFLLGRADVFIGNVATAEYYLDRYHLSNEYEFSNSYLIPVEYSFAVPKNNFNLLNRLNTGIRKLKSSGEYSDLYQKWFHKEPETIRGIVRLAWKIGTVALSIFLVVLLFGIRWNRQLKKEVARKTVDLLQLNESLTQQITIAQNNNEFLKQILNSSPRGIIIFDRKGRITKCNKIVYNLLDLTEELQGKHYSEILFLSELLDGKITPVLSGQCDHFLGEHKELKLSGTRMHHLRYNVYPLYQYDRKINGIILNFEDVTAELEMRNKLFEREKNRALSRLVAGIAHEIRNPLSAIRTFAELIPSKIQSTKFQQEISTCVPKEIIRINRLIEGLINYARPRKGKNELVSVKKVFDESAILLGHSIRSRGFKLRREAPDDLLIVTDNDQIKQIIINLVINATDALEEANYSDTEKIERIIELKAFAVENEVCIQVIDNGIGMDAEEKEKALEPFFTTKTKGTGLGLTLAEQLIRENSGRLLLDSEKNIGTVISMFFNSIEARQLNE